jgi:hypothetical protein
MPLPHLVSTLATACSDLTTVVYRMSGRGLNAAWRVVELNGKVR